MNNLTTYLKETFANKISALALILVGLTVMCMTGDATMLVFTLMFGVPLFFTKRNWML